MDVSHLLSASVTPVVLISACGLIVLALYNRLGAILSRLRSFHQQKLGLLKDLDEREADDTLILLERVDSQIGKVTAKAKMIQKGLYCLLSAVVAFLFCSLFAALATLRTEFNVVALAMHFLGLSLFLAGIGWAIRELALSITPLDEENAYLQTVTADNLAKLHVRKRRSTRSPRALRLPMYNGGDCGSQGRRMKAKRRRDPGALQLLGMPVNSEMPGVDADKLAPRNLMEPGVEAFFNDVGVPIELRNGSLQLQSAPAALRLFESSWRHLVYDSNMWLEWLVRQLSQMLNRKSIEAELKCVTIADNLEQQMIAAQVMMLNQLSGATVSRSRRSRTTPAGGTPPAARNWAKRSSVFSRGRSQPVVAAA